MKQAYSSTKTLQATLRHHLTQPRLQGLDQDGAERWQAIVKKLSELAAPVVSEVEAIFTDPKLTDEGKAPRLLAVGPRVVDSFRNVGVVVNQADQSKMRFEQLIFGPLTDKPKEGDAIVAELRAQEIRRSISGKGQPAGLAFLAAVQNGQLEEARAILAWPGGPQIPEDFERRGREFFAQRTNPEAWKSLQYVEVLREALNALAKQVAAWLLLLGSEPILVQKATGVSVEQPFKVQQLTEYLKQTAAGKK